MRYCMEVNQIYKQKIRLLTNEKLHDPQANNLYMKISVCHKSMVRNLFILEHKISPAYAYFNNFDRKQMVKIIWNIDFSSL